MRRTVTDKTVAHELVFDILEEQTGNLTQHHFAKDGPYRAVMAELTKFARLASNIALSRSVCRPNLHDPNWKEDWVNTTSDVMSQNGLQCLIYEECWRIKKRFPRKIRYSNDWIEFSLLKIARYSGAVSRLIVIGLNPNLLKMNYVEWLDHAAQLGQAFEDAGVTVITL